MAVQTNTFKGARYVPKFADPIKWSAENSYEAIESVQHNGFTYLSKQPVPVGVEITNTEFWLEWADPNAQMEQLRQQDSLQESLQECITWMISLQISDPPGLGEPQES